MLCGRRESGEWKHVLFCFAQNREMCEKWMGNVWACPDIRAHREQGSLHAPRTGDPLDIEKASVSDKRSALRQRDVMATRPQARCSDKRLIFFYKLSPGMIHHHEFWWRFFPRKELQRIYISAAIRTFAVSLLGIFLPLYLYVEQGYSFQDTLLFFIFYSLVFAITSPLGAKCAARFGPRHTIIFSVPLYLASVLLLFMLPSVNIPLIIISSLLGASQGFYWLGMHLVFHHASHKDHRGEEVGKRTAATIVAGMLGPLLGGFMILFVGFPAIFLITFLLLLLSGIVLFRHDDQHTRYHFSVRSVLNKKHWKDSLFFVSRGTEVIANGVIWPLLIFAVLRNYFSLGIAGSMLSGVSAVLLVSMGRLSDHTDKRKIIRIATLFDAVVWILRGLVITTTQVFSTTILAALTHGIREAPVGAMEYDKAQGEIAGYFVSREVFICLGRILLLTFVLMVNSLAAGMFLQAGASFAAFLF